MKPGKHPTPDKKRDLVIKLLERGFSVREIQYATGLGEATVYYIKNMYSYVRDENWEKARQLAEKYSLADTLRWALAYTGKTIPEEEIKKIQKEKEEVKDVVVEEKSVEVTVKKIDEDQIARVMLALGKILDELEALNVSVGKCAEAWK